MRHGANAGATGEPRQSPAPARPQDVGVGAVRRVCDISVRRFSSDARRQHPDDTSQAREARCPQRVADDPTGEIPIGRKVADGFVQPRFAALPARIAWALIRGLTRAGRRRNLLSMSTTHSSSAFFWVVGHASGSARGDRMRQMGRSGQFWW